MKESCRIAAVAVSLLIVGAGAAAAADPAALYSAGLRAYAAGDYAGAIEKLEAAVAAEPDNLIYGTDYRQAVIAAGEADAAVYDRCVEFFAGLVEQHPDAANAFLNYGFALVDKIPMEGSITQVILAHRSLGYFGAALDLDRSWLGLYSRGHALLFWPPIFGFTNDGIADLEAAIALSKEAGEKRPYYARAWAALGDGYWRLDDVERARAVWKEGRSQYPHDPELKARLRLAERSELDTYLEAHYETTRRVATHFKEIYGDRVADLGGAATASP